VETLFDRSQWAKRNSYALSRKAGLGRREDERDREVKSVRLHRARIAVATDAAFDTRSEHNNGACKNPRMDRGGDQAADRTRAAEGESARDGERAWTSHRLG